jgi:hypothetical protein
MSDVADFTNSEQKAVVATLEKRWKNGEVAIQMVDVDVSSADSLLGNLECPAFYWEFGDYHFLLMKTDVNEYRPQFFYQDTEEVGVETLEFDDIAECAMALLQLQANHALSLTMPDEKA